MYINNQKHITCIKEGKEGNEGKEEKEEKEEKEGREGITKKEIIFVNKSINKILGTVFKMVPEGIKFALFCPRGWPRY